MITSILMRGSHRTFGYRSSRADRMTVADAGAMYFDNGGSSHKPMNKGGHEKLEKSKEMELP